MVMFLEIMYFYLMIYGSLMVVSSSSWFVIWFGLELNMVAFIVLFGSKSKVMIESMFKYFFVQVVGSGVMLFFCMMSCLLGISDVLLMDYFISSNILLLVMVWKLGGGPFFFWLPVVSEGLSWFGNLIFVTWQKVAALWIIGLLSFGEIMVLMLGLYSVLVGCFGGLNQLLMKKIFIYSSVVHIGWMLMISYLSFYVMMFYYFMYVILSGALILFYKNSEVYHVNHLFTMSGSIGVMGFMFLSLFSLGGLPPLLGIFPKWLGLLSLLDGGYMILCFVLLLMGVLSLYYYLRLGYGWLLFLNYSSKWVGNLMGMSIFGVVMLGLSCFLLMYFSLMFL